MDKIPDMFNNSNFDLSLYEISELSDLEKINMKNRIKKRLKRKESKFLKRAAILLSGILLVTSISSLMGIDVFASINIVGIHIEEFVNTKNSSLQDYKTVIDKTIIDNGVTVKLNEVLLDDNQIIISSTFESDKAVEWTESAFTMPTVYINGRDVFEKGGGGSSLVKRVNEKTFNVFDALNTDKMQLQGDLNIKIVYEGIRLKSGKEIKGKWTFKFSANKDKLSSIVKCIPINKRIVLDSGQVMTVENLRISPASTTLNYTMTTQDGGDIKYDDAKYDMHFIVKDQNGNELKWNSGASMTRNNFFRYDTLDKIISKLYITPYLISGYEGEKKENFKKILEEESFEVRIE